MEVRSRGKWKLPMETAAEIENHNKPLKVVPGLSAVHRTPLSWRRLAQRYGYKEVE
jgi:hypothetical protein